VAPQNPKIYHIVPADRLAPIIAAGELWSDSEVAARQAGGTTIGMAKIKERRLRLELSSHPGLRVGECVPFYFCPRSVMLYVISQRNHPELDYRGGQVPVVHLEADLKSAADWARAEGRRWAFTLSNAGSSYFEDRCDLDQLDEVDWEAVTAGTWSGRGVDPGVMERKQAEFLMERSFPWFLIERIGVYSEVIYTQVANALPTEGHRPKLEVARHWYY
jgi:hypothetical protein